MVTKPARTKKTNLTTKDVLQTTPFMARNDIDLVAQEYQEPDYTDEENQYRHFLLGRILNARNGREMPRDEYNGMTYTQNYRKNMQSANSYTPPRQNAEDTQVVTGTTREKVLSIITAVLNLNFETKFKAFDEDDMEDEELGDAMSDLVEKANKVENWDDKKLYAYFELATQGDVYIQENWVEEMISKKKPIKLSDVTEEIMRTYKPSLDREVVFSGCRRTIIPGLQVYKGSMRERSLNNQPFICTREVKSYEYVKSIYGELPRFKYVPRKLKLSTEIATSDTSTFGINWRLEETQDEFVEILIYRDRFNKEFQLFLNGVMMLPVGFPFPWSYDYYDIVQGSLEPISAFFSESKSIPAKTKLDQEILDEMYRLAVLKTQKSFMPPIANYSQNVLSRKMFLPGAVANNLIKGDIEVVGGDAGMYSMKPSEFQMIEMVKKFIDEKSIDPVLQGQNPGGDITATQINSVMQQAKQKLGLLIFGFIRFHADLDTLRLYDILDNYTQPVDKQVDEVTSKLVDKYRTVTLSKDLGSAGRGIKKIDFTVKHNSPSEIYDMENGISRDKNGIPTSVKPPKTPMKIMQLNPNQLRQIKYNWYAEVYPTEKENSLAARIDFEDRITKAMQLFGQDSINVDYAKMQWAAKNKIHGDLFFKQGQPSVQGQPPGGAVGNAPGIPPIGPAQESNMQKIARPQAMSAGAVQAMQQGKAQ